MHVNQLNLNNLLQRAQKNFETGFMQQASEESLIDTHWLVCDILEPEVRGF